MPFQARMVRRLPAFLPLIGATRSAAAAWVPQCSMGTWQSCSAIAGVRFSTIPGGPDAPTEWCSIC